MKFLYSNVCPALTRNLSNELYHEVFLFPVVASSKNTVSYRSYVSDKNIHLKLKNIFFFHIFFFRSKKKYFEVKTKK